MIDEVPLHVPRHALSPRHAVRAGEVWRLFQTAAVEASARRGWPPERYRREGTGFIVSRMTVRHHRQLAAGESPVARTWVHDFRRGMLSRREIRLLIGEEVIAATTQQWVHVDRRRMKPARASAEMLAAFRTHDGGNKPIEINGVTLTDGTSWTLMFPCWYSWMDVLGHVNHPTYLDWCDEALMRRVAAQGADPHALIPVAEEVRFKRGVTAGQSVSVTTRLSGSRGSAAVFEHAITADGQHAATAVTVRRLAEGDLVAMLSDQVR